MKKYILQCVQKATSTDQKIPTKQITKAILTGAKKCNTKKNVPPKQQGTSQYNGRVEDFQEKTTGTCRHDSSKHQECGQPCQMI